MRIGFIAIVLTLLGAGLSGCAVSPGTPLFEAMSNEDRSRFAGPGLPPVAPAEPSGLIVEEEREATRAYLKSLAAESP